MTARVSKLQGWTPERAPHPLAEGYVPPADGARSGDGFAPMVLCLGSRRAVAQIDEEWLGMHDADDDPTGGDW